MAETKDLEWLVTCTMEESQENAGGAKPDKDDQDRQDNKKQCFAQTSSALRTGAKEKVERSETKKRVGCFLAERSKLYEFSQSNRILLVIPSSQSDNNKSSNCTLVESFN